MPASSHLSRRSSLHALPPELVVCLVGYLPDADACRLGGTCRSLRPALCLAFFRMCRGLIERLVREQVLVEEEVGKLRARVEEVGRQFVAEGTPREAVEQTIQSSRCKIDDFERHCEERIRDLRGRVVSAVADGNRHYGTAYRVPDLCCAVAA